MQLFKYIDKDERSPWHGQEFCIVLDNVSYYTVHGDNVKVSFGDRMNYLLLSGEDANRFKNRMERSGQY